jgi:hypothetical protein
MSANSGSPASKINGGAEDPSAAESLDDYEEELQARTLEKIEVDPAEFLQLFEE